MKGQYFLSVVVVLFLASAGRTESAPAPTTGGTAVTGVVKFKGTSAKPDAHRHVCRSLLRQDAFFFGPEH